MNISPEKTKIVDKKIVPQTPDEYMTKEEHDKYLKDIKDNAPIRSADMLKWITENKDAIREILK